MRDRERATQPEEYRVTLTVQGDDACPRFANGDRLICASQALAEIGEDVVVIVRDGNIRIGRLSALEAEAVTIVQESGPLSLGRLEIGAIWPIRHVEKDIGIGTPG